MSANSLPIMLWSRAFMVCTIMFVCDVTLHAQYFPDFIVGEEKTEVQDFNEPVDVAVASSGNFYVADAGSKFIKKFNASGSAILQWGGPGTGDGSFESLSAVAVDASEKIYTAEFASRRIQIFDANGGFISSWVANEAVSIADIAVDTNGDVLVANYGGNNLLRYTAAGVFVRLYSGVSSGKGFSLVNSVDVDKDGNVYVSDMNNYRIVKFDSNGAFSRAWGSQGISDDQFFSTVTRIATDAAGNLFVSSANTIKKFSSSGAFVLTWGTGQGPADGQMYLPRGVDVAPNGDVYVADTENSRVQKFSGTGSFLTKWIDLPSADGNFQQPMGVAFDASGNFYVADTYNHRIQKFSSSGVFLTKWGSLGTGNGQFNTPSDIDVDASGNVYVVDTNNHRIQKFSSAGTFIAKWGIASGTDGNFFYPHSIAIDRSGAVYVADSRIQKFSSAGAFISKWGSTGSGNGQLNGLGGIDVDADGNIYVADGGNNRIQKFTSAGTFLSKWGSADPGDMFMRYPRDIAVDDTGNVYMTGSEGVIRKYSALAEFVAKWGAQGSNSFFGLDVNVQGKVAVTEGALDHVIVYVPISIKSLSISGGAPGATVTITGSAFKTGAMKVYFGEVEANAQVNSSTSITTQVPPGAVTARVRVEREGAAAFSENEFVVLPLQINSFPALVSIGETFQITGAGFSSTPESNTVKINGVSVPVIASSPTTLVVTMPASAATGKISVTISGRTVTSCSNIVVSKLAVLTVNITPAYMEGQSPALTVTVNNMLEVASVSLRTRGIVGDEADMRSDDLAFSTASNTISLEGKWSAINDPMGLYARFVFRDNEGNEIISAPAYSYIKFPASTPSQQLAGLKFGKSVSDYQIISVPLMLSSNSSGKVFESLGEYDDRKWRLFSLSKNGYVENPRVVTPGTGYWFISKNEVDVHPGEGVVVPATKENPFIMQLVKGWNMIGNPYNFNISWDDVKNANPSASVGNLRKYSDGTFSENNVLQRQGGALVYSDTEQQIIIPLQPVTAGGRKKNSASSRDEKNWLVALTLDDGVLRNELAGFGMHKGASDAKDPWDEMQLPLMGDMNKMTLHFHSAHGVDLVKDVVASRENYSWDLNVSCERRMTLSWDNSQFGGNFKGLMLERDGEVGVVDMRVQGLITLTPGQHKLRIHFGDKEYIEEQLSLPEVRFGRIYPNPIVNSNTLSIPVNFPDDDNHVSVGMFDGQGRLVHQSAEFRYNRGRYVITWPEPFPALNSGLFLIKITSRTRGAVTTSVQRVSVNPN